MTDDYLRSEGLDPNAIAERGRQAAKAAMLKYQHICPICNAPMTPLLMECHDSSGWVVGWICKTIKDIKDCPH